MNKQIYLLVADDGRARLFQADIPVARLTPIYDELHFEGRRKPGEIYADRPGRQHNDFGGSHSFAGERRSHEEEAYARKLCLQLERDRREGRFEALVLMAPPHLLGELRRHLSEACAGMLLGTHHKDVVKNSEADIMALLLQGNPELATGS